MKTTSPKTMDRVNSKRRHRGVKPPPCPEIVALTRLPGHRRKDWILEMGITTCARHPSAPLCGPRTQNSPRTNRKQQLLPDQLTADKKSHQRLAQQGDLRQQQQRVDLPRQPEPLLVDWLPSGLHLALLPASTHQPRQDDQRHSGWQQSVQQLDDRPSSHREIQCSQRLICPWELAAKEELPM